MIFGCKFIQYSYMKAIDMYEFIKLLIFSDYILQSWPNITDDFVLAKRRLEYVSMVKYESNRPS